MDIDVNEMEQIVPGIYKKSETTYYIKCSVAGTMHYCDKARLTKLIAKFGSIEKVGTGYISRAGKHEDKPDKVPAVAVKLSNKDASKDLEPEIKVGTALDQKKPTSMSLTNTDIRLGKMLSDNWERCLRTDLFKQNHGYCNGCKWYPECQYKDKGWAKTDADRNPQALRGLKMGLPTHPQGRYAAI